MTDMSVAPKKPTSRWLLGILNLLSIFLAAIIGWGYAFLLAFSSDSGPAPAAFWTWVEIIGYGGVLIAIVCSVLSQVKRTSTWSLLAIGYIVFISPIVFFVGLGLLPK